MSPIKIKWVNTETGEEYQNDAVSLHFKPLNSIGEPIPGFSGKLLSKVPQWLSTVITENVSKPCQSTGLTDSRGVEVFDGNIILVCFPRADAGYFYSVFFDRGGFKLEGFYFPDQDRPDGQRHWLGIELLLDAIEDGARLYCVGNRWMPADELKARAKLIYQPQPIRY